MHRTLTANENGFGRECSFGDKVGVDGSLFDQGNKLSSDHMNAGADITEWGGYVSDLTCNA